MANLDEIASGIYRIHTPIPPSPGLRQGFSFNQYLIADDEPLLFHTGPRALSDDVRAAIERVLPLASLRWIAFSHVEADECGGLNALLVAAPNAEPACSRVAAMTSVTDLAQRAPRVLFDGEVLPLGRHSVRWLDTPHLPHGWECGHLSELTTSTLFCGDLFTQPGTGDAPLVETDILEPSEAFRHEMDYFARSPETRMLLGKLAAERPTTLACMHGSAWHGSGARLLLALAERVSPR